MWFISSLVYDVVYDVVSGVVSGVVYDVVSGVVSNMVSDVVANIVSDVVSDVVSEWYMMSRRWAFLGRSKSSHPIADACTATNYYLSSKCVLC